MRYVQCAIRPSVRVPARSVWCVFWGKGVNLQHTCQLVGPALGERGNPPLWLHCRPCCAVRVLRTCALHARVLKMSGEPNSGGAGAGELTHSPPPQNRLTKTRGEAKTRRSPRSPALDHDRRTRCPVCPCSIHVRSPPKQRQREQEGMSSLAQSGKQGGWRQFVRRGLTGHCLQWHQCPRPPCRVKPKSLRAATQPAGPPGQTGFVGNRQR